MIPQQKSIYHPKHILDKSPNISDNIINLLYGGAPLKASTLKRFFKYYLYSILAINIIAATIYFALVQNPWTLAIIAIFNAILAIPTVLVGLFIFFYQVGETKQTDDLVNELFSKTKISK